MPSLLLQAFFPDSYFLAYQFHHCLQLRTSLQPPKSSQNRRFLRLESFPQHQQRLLPLRQTLLHAPSRNFLLRLHDPYMDKRPNFSSVEVLSVTHYGSFNMSALAPHDCFRIQAILADAIKKLNFLSSVAQSTKSMAAGADELTELMGEEISRIINEQRELEQRFGELVQTRSSLTGISNKEKLHRIKQDIREVAQGLRENTKNLTRVLKDNPNIQGNLIKIDRDRSQLIALLAEVNEQLSSCTYVNFAYRVSEDLQSQDLLKRKRQQEIDTVKNIKQLQEDLKREREEFQKETKETQEEIQKLKDEVLELKTNQTIRIKYEEKDSKAREASESRAHELDEKQQEDFIKELLERKETEVLVHRKIQDFFARKEESLKEQEVSWNKRVEKELAEMDEQISQMNEKKITPARERIKLLEELIQRETQEKKMREEEAQRVEEQRRQDALEREEQRKAVKIIVREYLEWKENASKRKMMMMMGGMMKKMM